MTMLSNAHSTIALSMDVFRIIRTAINKRFGILFSDSDRYLLESRLSARLTDLELSSFEEYIAYFKTTSNDAELDTAIELLTNNETYFFREDYQLSAFNDELLPRLQMQKRKERQLTIWSAGCSSGEEAYSIAIFIAESGLFSGWDVRIFGSDISSRMLERARQSRFGKSAFRTTSEYLKMKYFKRQGAQWELDSQVREKCSFAKINLLDTDRTAMLGRFDAIFCRNVLMYFDKKARINTVHLFHRHLNPNGYLLLGHTESLFNQDTPFTQVNLREALVYQKQESALA
ncbi:MAG: protein-glutamate O-methyltransferase CheR [Deltaproteobacteria bacterium]|nr:protein-glutamate O-methyltransferase CheR [Deltaproteobacteria bacterium]